MLCILNHTFKMYFFIAIFKLFCPKSKKSDSTALRLTERYLDTTLSLEKLHKMHKRGKPTQMMKYRLAIQLFKDYNGKIQNDDWLDLNFQQNFNKRNNFVQINDVSRIRIGRNSIINRLNCQNNAIDYDWLNQSLIHSN